MSSSPAPSHASQSSDIEQVVVVGAGLSGLRTVERLRRLRFGGRIVLIGAEKRLPYDRPPLSKHLLVATDEPAEPVHLRPASRMDALDVDLRLGTRASALDLDRREVVLEDGEAVPWDRIVIATGVRPRTIPAWAGIPNVTTLRTFEDCLHLRKSLQAGGRLVVVGGGVLGCEVAASARSTAMEVDLIEPLAQPLLRAAGPRVGAYIAGHHRANGVAVHLGTSVTSLRATDDGLRVELSDGSTLAPDHVLVAIGSVPNTEWLEGSGLDLTDGVVCDATGAASADGVFAVGDVARVPRGRFGPFRLEHWTNAVDSASHVAAGLLEPPAGRGPFVDLPYFWSDQYGFKLQVYGLPDSDDEVYVVHGSLDERDFVALHVRADVVTAVSGVGHPAALARSRGLLDHETSLNAAVAAAPWTPSSPD